MLYLSLTEKQLLSSFNLTSLMLKGSVALHLNIDFISYICLFHYFHLTDNA